jgi:hypothetical protein
MRLPPETLSHILRYCGIDELRKVRLTSKLLRRMVAEIVEKRLNRLARRWKERVTFSEGTCAGQPIARESFAGRPYVFNITQLRKPTGSYVSRRWVKATIVSSERHRTYGPDRSVMKQHVEVKAKVIDGVFVRGTNIRTVRLVNGAGFSYHTSHHLGNSIVCYSLPFYLPIMRVDVPLDVYISADDVEEVRMRSSLLSFSQNMSLIAIPDNVLFPMIRSQ